MRVGSSESEAGKWLFLKWNFSLWVGDELLPQAKDSKYLSVMFTRDGIMEHKMDRRHGETLPIKGLFRSVHISIPILW